jgi:excisionase family DNA binding protein
VSGRVVDFPAPEQRFIDAHELAQVMGVSERTIARMVREGMPSERWGRKVRRFYAPACIEWARNRRDAA